MLSLSVVIVLTIIVISVLYCLRWLYYILSHFAVIEDKGQDEKELADHITTFYPPFVQEDFKPLIGMQFEYFKDAFDFYKRYFSKGRLTQIFIK